MISVIVPVYNVEPYVSRCLESIKNQSFTDLEIILVDDGSTDNSGKICDEYAAEDKRIKVFHTLNRGLSAARNYGIKYASGDYLSFIDSDDWIDNDFYEVMMNLLIDANADICVCGFECFSENSTRLWQPESKVYDSDSALIELLSERINNNAWNKLYRRCLIQELSENNKLFPEGKNYEDISVMHRIIRVANNVALISRPLYHYNIRQDSITKTYSVNNLLDYCDAYFSRVDFFQNNDSVFFNAHFDLVTRTAVQGISRLWRWWFSCCKEDKKSHLKDIEYYKDFTASTVPLFGFKTWPFYLRLSSFFMHSKTSVSFFTLYSINRFYRLLSDRS